MHQLPSVASLISQRKYAEWVGKLRRLGEISLRNLPINMPKIPSYNLSSLSSLPLFLPLPFSSHHFNFFFKFYFLLPSFLFPAFSPLFPPSLLPLSFPSLNMSLFSRCHPPFLPCSLSFLYMSQMASSKEGLIFVTFSPRTMATVTDKCQRRL